MIDVVGMGDGGPQDLPAGIRELLLQAGVLLGGRRHLALIPEVPGQQRYPWPSPLRQELPALIDRVTMAGDGPVVAVASGDPLFSGIGTTLIDLLGRDQVRVHPWISSDALARARMGWAAQDCQVISLVGRSLDAIRRHLEPGRLIILCSDGSTPAQVAALLVETGWGQSSLTALWNLGGKDEGRREAFAQDWDRSPTPDLVVLAVELPPGAATAFGVAAGLPDQAFDNDGQLTKREMRAHALAQLRPVRGELLWDLGAGAGSIGIEWARLSDGARVVAVERDALRASRIRANARGLGVGDAVEVVLGETLDTVATEELPDPDAIFIGGGLSDALITRCWDRLRPGGRLVIHAVTLDAEAILVDAQHRLGGALTRISVEHARPLGSYLAWTPARPVVSWSITKQGS